jgi:hypothetical protein
LFSNNNILRILSFEKYVKYPISFVFPLQYAVLGH